MSTLTPTETAALVVLMAEARMVENAELRALANVELTGASRAKLVDQLGLVTQRRAGRGYAFALSAKGRETVLRLLSDLPKPQGGSAGALQRLVSALYRLGISAGDFGELASRTTQPSGERASRTTQPSGERASRTTQPSGDLASRTPQPSGDLATRTPQPSGERASRATQLSASTAPVILGDPVSQVRAAYAGLATHPGAWVALADLRAALPGLSRSDVDTALRTMARTTGVQLIPVANLKSLRQRDREAALHLGGEDNHVLAIEAA
jgi:hypothetical protein